MAGDSIQPNRFCGGTFHGGRNKITHRPQLPRTGTARNTAISWLRPSPLKVETFRWLCGFPIQVVIEHSRNYLVLKSEMVTAIIEMLFDILIFVVKWFFGGTR